MNILRNFKRLKYFLKGLIRGEFPRKDILDFMELAPLDIVFSGETIPLVCWTSWKTSKLTRSHYYSFKNYVKKTIALNFIFLTMRLKENGWKITILAPQS